MLTRRASVAWLGSLLLAWACPGCGASGRDGPPQIGSKAFTESIILAEIARQHIGAHTVSTPRHREGLGGTQVLWKALRRGDIDLYPEYTGTIAAEILGRRNLDQAGIRNALARQGVRMTKPLGFDNTYALGMRAAAAEALGIERMTDLTSHPDLRFGFTSEFMQRADGWPGLRTHYRLPHTNVRGLDHDLAYRGLQGGTLDLIDLYSTDAEILYYGLRVLDDDRHYFSTYEAVYLYRDDLPTAFASSLEALAGTVNQDTMRELNARVKLEGHDEDQVARAHLARLGLGGTRPLEDRTAAGELLRHTVDHLLLVGVSLSAGIGLAIPLGILAARRRRLAQVVLTASGVLQTIPSLALLVVMIPLLGIGAPPAIAALFLYSLLPIVRNTHAGLVSIPRAMIDSADALGLDRRARLRLIELPLAASSILAGIKTAAVINVGTATLGALVGAGGYGQPILTGIRLDDTGLIMQGAIPAAALALAVQWTFDLLERHIGRR